MRTTLGAIGQVSSGSTPSRAESAKYFTQNGTPWVKTGDLNNSIVSRTSEQITAQAVASGAKVFPSGTVLVAMYGGFNQIGRTGLLSQPAAVNQAISAIQVDRTIADPHYVLQYLNYKVEDWRRFAASSRKDPNIARSDVVSFPLEVPSLATQKKIAEILHVWDEAVGRVGAELKLAKERRTALISRLVFPMGPPKGLDWAELPDEWKLEKIGTLAQEISRRNADLVAETVLTCSKHFGFMRSEDYFSRVTHSSNTSSYKLISRNQFGFPSNHIEEGSIGLQNIVGLGAVSPIYTVFEFGPKIDPEFAYLVLKTNSYRHMFKVSTSSSVNRRGNLRWSGFSQLRFPVPPMELQRSIVVVTRQIDRELSLLDRKLELLKRQKQGLMQKLLSGEIRVNLDDATDVETSSEGKTHND